MDAIDKACEKKWIRAKGVSCHTLDALRTASASQWNQLHLVRVNPKGLYMDTQSTGANGASDITPVMDQIKLMHANKRGVIGMKIFAQGRMTRPNEREESMRFAMSCSDIDAIMVGLATPRQIDAAIELTNRCLAELDAADKK